MQTEKKGTLIQLDEFATVLQVLAQKYKVQEEIIEAEKNLFIGIDENLKNCLKSFKSDKEEL